MMKKKGDISIQVIVVAILALLVLVILSVMFITKMGKAGQQFDACESKGGRCLPGCGSGESEYWAANGACVKSNNGDESYKCCLPLDQTDPNSVGTT